MREDVFFLIHIKMTLVVFPKMLSQGNTMFFGTLDANKYNWNCFHITFVLNQDSLHGLTRKYTLLSDGLGIS